VITNDEQIVKMTRTEVKDLLTRFADAQQASGVDELSGLLTDDFTLVGPLGFVVHKPEWLEQFRTGMLQIESLQWDELDIRTHAYGHLAIAIGKLTQAATYAGKPAGGRFRVTMIAIGRGTSWHLAGAHCSPITPSEASPNPDAT
jgi:ketosteroid isomerase-like protein